MKKETRRWVRKAEGDLHTATQLAQSDDPVHDHICFHSQQCAEKYLKALMQELGIRIFRTHNLEKLLVFIQPHHPSMRSLRRGLTFLSPFAVESRYPGLNATKRDAAAALRSATRVRDKARSLLGIP